MKVAIITYTLNKKMGGISSSVITLFSELGKLADIDLYSTFHEGEREDIESFFFSMDNVNMVALKTTKWYYSKEFRKLLKRRIKEYDLVHINGLWTYPSYVASKVAFRNKIPYIISPHGMLETDALRRKRIKKFLYWNLMQKTQLQRANAIHCLSESEYKNAKEFFPKSCLRLIPTGVHLQEGIKQKENIPKENINIGFIGRFHAIKGLDRLIHAFDTLTCNNLNLLIAGGGEKSYELYIKNIIASCVHKDKISLKGFLEGEEKVKFFKKVDLMVVPSFTEGLSMVILESLSYGIPLLVTKYCNFEILKKYKAGVVIEDNSEISIAQGLTVILGMNIDEMSQNALRLAKEKFDIRNSTKEVVSFYNEIIKLKNKKCIS